jgi:hypothetical protein
MTEIDTLMARLHDMSVPQAIGSLDGAALAAVARSRYAETRKSGAVAAVAALILGVAGSAIGSVRQYYQVTARRNRPDGSNAGQALKLIRNRNLNGLPHAQFTTSGKPKSSTAVQRRKLPGRDCPVRSRRQR